MAECKFCHGGIEWRKVGGKSVPYNLDGTPHRCKSQASGTAPAGAPVPCTARLDAFTAGSATFRVKSGKSKTYAILRSTAQEWAAAGYKPGTWLEFTLDAKNFVQNPKQVPEPAWAKDLEAQQEIAAPGQPDHKQPPAAAAPPQETRTSPEGPAASRPGPADIFPLKDRLIAAQCLLKAWTDLYISGHPGEAYDSKNFADAREEILTAIENDLPRVMGMGVR
jgi:hypothetical protein